MLTQLLGGVAKRPMKRRSPNNLKARPFKKARTGQRPVQARMILAKPTAERKNIDFGYNNSPALGPAWSSPSALPLDIVSQGASATTRVGRKILLDSIDIRMDFRLAATSTGGSPLRFKVFYDKQSNGAAPAVLDVLTTNDFHSANNLANSDRFVTIFDEITEPISVGNNFSIALRKFKKLNLPVVFNDGNLGTIADIQSGGVFFMWCQDGAIGVASPTVTFFSRIRFLDN